MFPSWIYRLSLSTYTQEMVFNTSEEFVLSGREKLATSMGKSAPSISYKRCGAAGLPFSHLWGTLALGRGIQINLSQQPV